MIAGQRGESFTASRGGGGSLGREGRVLPPAGVEDDRWAERGEFYRDIDTVGYLRPTKAVVYVKTLFKTLSCCCELQMYLNLCKRLLV